MNNKDSDWCQIEPTWNTWSYFKYTTMYIQPVQRCFRHITKIAVCCACVAFGLFVCTVVHNEESSTLVSASSNICGNADNKVLSLIFCYCW